jgi:hypothetical protein
MADGGGAAAGGFLSDEDADGGAAASGRRSSASSHKMRIGAKHLERTVLTKENNKSPSSELATNFTRDEFNSE